MEPATELGKGRIDPATIRARFTSRPKGFMKMTCSECGREYYIRTGDNHKVFKTCSTTCSTDRQSRLQKKNLAVRRAEKKFIGIYFDKAEYNIIKRKASGKPVSRYIRAIIVKEIEKK